MAEHRLALVVGANRGIGLGVVKAFLARGWDVIATARKPAEAIALNALASGSPGRVTVAALELNDPASLDGFAAAFDNGALAGKVLDIALINAGVAGPAHRSASQATEAETGALMMTNAIAPIRLARAVAPRVRAGTGVIAFTSSVMGSVALNPGGHELYRASKAALNSLTRGLYAEVSGRKLTVLSLHPGWVRTDMGGPGAAVSVEDSARGMVDVMLAQQGRHHHVYLDYQGKEIAW
ncbi:SDR family oxidoreductase [Rhodopila sp.]|jgi:NAD(P)-dependent dehydrogenase (short-subunit alcohol dehydrogenase family)|uniref:SDR family oxidoreductase n=1 Tax=Rhodopila sp. TaxID=2480087 RepID=UPI002C8E4A8B|nr:SDR family oxidoreductase [Rhodopila sp.]HVZ07245.1 SDR family oxidoreductase [Rhodopila sp.]